ncbi:IS200/IS605 family accessory protein TnpB-related protein [Microcoleus sp. bin38.metabat.b11b12b14.051]|uniref:IS200/IS605 family accessory protein TnpB-related protein n=1 Tax=Microcoleus sp. bin38.metabat.b11b12b14.051 TaxID=2742709 RepID=UPI0025EEA7CE|nr:IS200/IS605 family accessory protein TnpB-related protein [Microcoleus sp. bin38.metabat.b11b12b14.051]
MPSLTYVKGLPTPESELNALGFSQMEMFLTAFAPVFRLAATETVNQLLACSEFNKSKWNTYLQATYSINKRHANGIISYSKGKVDSAKQHRSLHIKTLTGKTKSIEVWLPKAEKKLKTANKFYSKKNWPGSTVGCNFPLSCSLKHKGTNWQNLRFQIHNKKRKLFLIQNKLAILKVAPIKVFVPHNQIFLVGSKDETLGNGIAQWNGSTLKIRTPACLEESFGKNVSAEIGNFDRNINRLPTCGAKTWHLFKKDHKWKVAVSFTPSPVESQSFDRAYGCIGIDMNPGSIGWACIDIDGNLKSSCQIALQMGLPNGAQQAQIVDACLQLVTLALLYQCPIVCEELDFSDKKQRLGEKSRKYARMLSSWAYNEFYKQLNAILANRGIELITVNPAFTSIIGLFKYLKMYGLASDESAALVIARRGMRLSEKLPDSITAYVEVNSDKHVWSQWAELNRKTKQSGMVNRRHDYYIVSNWSFLVNPELSGREAFAH